MTAPRMSIRQQDRARLLARDIGAAFRRERLARGDAQRDVAACIGISNAHVVSRFENGATPNLMLGTAVRFLALYGLTLSITKAPRGTYEVHSHTGIGVSVLESYRAHPQEAPS